MLLEALNFIQRDKSSRAMRVAARSNACLVWVAGSNPVGGHGCQLCLLCVVRWRSLRRADHSSRGFLPSAVDETRKGGLGLTRGLSSYEKKNNRISNEPNPEVNRHIS